MLSARRETANQAFSRPPAREDATNCAGQDPHDEKQVCVRVDGFHSNGLVSYAFDAIQLHNKQYLGEAAHVRCDKLAQRLDKNFTLGQRVKLRRAEPIDALL